MRPEWWKTVEDTYHASLQCKPEDRSAFLDQACNGDTELRREVESLLTHADRLESFMEAPGSFIPGQEFNQYRIVELLGSGGMADVYRARDLRLNRDVALKVLRGAAYDREGLDRLYREARLLASLNHPNIGSIYGLEEADGKCALVLELVEGELLSDRIATGTMSTPVILDVARQIAVGVHVAHTKSIIHRDLKPTNLKLTPDGTLKILDFGIAKLLAPTVNQNEPTMDSISREGTVIGTFSYMSPEQARGKPVDARTDIWSFGCVLYEAFTGKIAFAGETFTDVVAKIVSEEPDWKRLLHIEGPANKELQRLIQRCLEKDPAARYQSMNEVAGDLERVRKGMLSPKPPAPTPQPDIVPLRKLALPLFMLAQFGYLALYVATMNYIDASVDILASDFRLRQDWSVVALLILAMCGVAVRIYLMSAVGWRHPAAGEKFQYLFPILLVLDSIWAVAPLLLWRHIGYGIALTCVAMLAYVPFAERTLVRSLYPASE